MTVAVAKIEIIMEAYVTKSRNGNMIDDRNIDKYITMMMILGRWIDR